MASNGDNYKTDQAIPRIPSQGDRMTNVTLVGEKLAKEGNEFYFHGPLTECKECKVKGVCFNLEEGRTYRIISIREMTHECEIHDGKVVAVEFELLPLEIALDPKHAIEGSNQKVRPQNCKNTTCPHVRICSKPKVSKKSSYKVLEVKGELDCPAGKDLRVVVMEPA